jgi:hypothetical protein
LLWLLACARCAQAASLDEVIARLDADAAGGKPLVAHVVVALCDNEFQGIVPVPAKLGDGDAPQSNLYWGALYGVRTFFRNQPGWKPVPVSASSDPRILDRVMFRHEVTRHGRTTPVLLVAEAWRGRNIADAVRHFLELNRGEHPERLQAGDFAFDAGGAAHVVAFVGHNGLMDFPAPALPPSRTLVKPHASVVLACMSDSYFSPLLRQVSWPLITTSGLMAPEAYTLASVLDAWFSGSEPAQVRQAAARAYAKYQRIPEKPALRLFVTPAAP